MVYLFVYGTLKRGFTNHYMLRGSRFISEAYVEGYTVPDKNIPVAVPAPEECRVYGELYMVDYRKLHRLDIFEQGYSRVETLATTITSSRKYRAYIYIIQRPATKCYYSYYTLLE